MLIIANVLLAFVLAIAVALVAQSTSGSRAAATNAKRRVAYEISRAGIEKAIFCLNQSSGANCGGSFGASYTGESDVSVGTGVFTTTVTTVDAATRDIISTAAIPNDTTPVATVTLNARAVISTDDVSFNYGAQVGDGGLIMEENSSVAGGIYSNGDIVGANGAEITGDAYVAGGTAAAPDQQWETQNADFIFGKANPIIDAAQSFVPATTAVVNRVSLYIKKVGSPSNLSVHIAADNGNKPDNDALASATISASLVTGTYGWIDASFLSPPTLNAGTRYWIVLDASKDANNYWTIGLDNTDGYANGTGKSTTNWTAGGASWAAAGGDINFRVWMGGVITKISDVTIEGDAHANTIEGSTIHGDAYYQTLTNTTVTGTLHAGSPDPGPVNFPISSAQIDEWKDAAAGGQTIVGDYNPEDGATISLGPAVITGNMYLDNGQTLTVTGTIHVQGSIEIDNNANVRLDTGYGAYSGVIIADGTIHVRQNGSFQGSGPGSYIMMLSTASGGGHHGSAVDLHNNATGVIVYAPNGLIYLHNNVQVTELTGDSIQISQSAELIYEQGLQSAVFSSGPSAGWQFEKGSLRYAAF